MGHCFVESQDLFVVLIYENVIFAEMPFSPRSKSLRMFSDEISESTSVDGDEAVVCSILISLK